MELCRFIALCNRILAINMQYNFQKYQKIKN